MTTSRWNAARRILCATLGAAALTVGAVAVAPAADAAPSCASNRVCLFQNTNYGGSQWDFEGPTKAGDGFIIPDFKPLGHGLDDNASSMMNKTGRYVYFCRNRGCATGTDAYLALPNSVDTTFSNNDFNDKASGILIMPAGYRPPAGGNHNAKVPAH